MKFLDYVKRQIDEGMTPYQPERIKLMEFVAREA